MKHVSVCIQQYFKQLTSA